MAIEIYTYEPSDPDSMFPAFKNGVKLVAVAPFEQREKVELYCAARNKEAAEAGYRRRYGFDVTAVEIWS